MTWACGEARWAGQQGGVQHGDAQTDGIASREESMSDRTCAQDVDGYEVLRDLRPRKKMLISRIFHFSGISPPLTSVTLTLA